jgi:hypothetical protein
MNWYAITIETATGETETFERADSIEQAKRQAAEWLARNAPDAKVK